MRNMIYFLLLVSFSLQAEVLRIGHRGAPYFAPENTISSFEKAIELKADFLETDVQQTKDKVLVIMHDSTIDRTTSGKGKVSELTWAELEKLGVPSLDNVLALGISNSAIKFILELKDGNETFPGIEEALVDMVKSKGMENRVLLKSFSYPQLQRLRILAPAIPQIYVFFTAFTSLGITIDQGLRFHNPLKLNVEYLQSHQTLTGYSFVKGAHEAGKKVILWGVENKDSMQAWKNHQADGIETDRLDLLNTLN